MQYTQYTQASLIYCQTYIYTLIVYTIVCGNTCEGPIHRSLISERGLYTAPLIRERPTGLSYMIGAYTQVSHRGLYTGLIAPVVYIAGALMNIRETCV